MILHWGHNFFVLGALSQHCMQWTCQQTTDRTGLVYDSKQILQRTCCLHQALSIHLHQCLFQLGYWHLTNRFEVLFRCEWRWGFIFSGLAILPSLLSVSTSTRYFFYPLSFSLADSDGVTIKLASAQLLTFEWHAWYSLHVWTMTMLEALF